MAFLEINRALKYKVSDISLASWGRKEIQLAENEMPGLMALAQKIRTEKAACRIKDNGQSAYDDSDRNAYRNTQGIRS